MKKSEGPLTDTEVLAKIRHRRQRIRTLDQKIATQAEVLKKLKGERDEEQGHLDEEIDDKPEGDLGFRDQDPTSR